MLAALRTRTALAWPAMAAVAAALVLGVLSGYDPRIGLVFAVGLSFLALVFVDLLVGFAVLALFAFLESYSMVGTVSVTKLLGLLLVISWLAAVTVAGRRHRNLVAERPGLIYLLLLFLGWTTISVAWSADRGEALTSASRYALNAALLPIAYAAIRDRRDATRILAVLVGGAVVAAVSGLAARPAGADAARATGTVGDANELAAALVVGLWVAAAFAVNRHVRPPMRLVAMLAVPLCLVGVLATLSRGGLLGLAAAVVAAIGLAGRWRSRILPAAATLAVAAIGYFAVIAGPAARERVTTVGGGTGRLDLWTIAGRMIAAHPVRGVGAGQFQTESVHYLLRPGALQRSDYVLLTPKVAHNTYLTVTAELGVVGMALFLALVVVCVGCAVLAIREFRRAGDERMEILARGFAAGVAGYLVTMLFVSENFSKLMWLLFALGPALFAVARREAATADRDRRPEPLSAPSGATAGDGPADGGSRWPGRGVSAAPRGPRPAPHG